MGVGTQRVPTPHLMTIIMTMMMMVMMMTDNTVQNSSKAFHDIKETEIAHKRDDDENLDDGDAVNDETQVHYGH